MRCPKCGFEQLEGAAECPRCGVIFAKLRPSPAPDPPPSAAPPPPAEVPAQADAAAPLPTVALPDVYQPPPPPTGPPVPDDLDLPSPRALDRPAWRALAWGAGLAAFVSVVPFLRFVFSYLVTLVHELGHTATLWLLGYPTIPSFDFLYGGGVSFNFDRSRPLVLLLIAGWVWLFWLARSSRPSRVLLSLLAGVWLLAMVTSLGDVLAVAMGHGGEIIFAGIFLHRAMTGAGSRFPEAERPLYAFSAIFILLQGLRLTAGLALSEAARRTYESSKGGMAMDFSRLAGEHWLMSLAAVARIFLLLYLAVPPAVWLLVRYGERLEAALARLLDG